MTCAPPWALRALQVHKLRAQMAAPPESVDLAKAAKLLTDIHAVDCGAEFAGVEAVAADEAFLQHTSAHIHEQAQVRLPALIHKQRCRCSCLRSSASKRWGAAGCYIGPLTTLLTSQLCTTTRARLPQGLCRAAGMDVWLRCKQRRAVLKAGHEGSWACARTHDAHTHAHIRCRAVTLAMFGCVVGVDLQEETHPGACAP